MSDWNETKESQEGDQPKESSTKDLTPVGRSSMRGEVGEPPDKTQDQPTDDAKLATGHVGQTIEKEPVVETEPYTIKLDEGGQSEDHEGNKARRGERGSLEAPENYRPGGSERRG